MAKQKKTVPSKGQLERVMTSIRRWAKKHSTPHKKILYVGIKGYTPSEISKLTEVKGSFLYKLVACAIKGGHSAKSIIAGFQTSTSQ